jgi:hypothetical protein
MIMVGRNVLLVGLQTPCFRGLSEENQTIRCNRRGKRFLSFFSTERARFYFSHAPAPPLSSAPIYIIHKKEWMEMAREIILAIVVFAFISGCSCKTEWSSDELSNDIQNSKLSPSPVKVVQTKSFNKIVTLLPQVQNGNSREKVESILGMPQDTSYGRGGYSEFTYLERPGEFGTMKAILVTFKNNVVQEVEESEISIDPW